MLVVDRNQQNLPLGVSFKDDVNGPLNLPRSRSRDNREKGIPYQLSVHFCSSWTEALSVCPSERGLCMTFPIPQEIIGGIVAETPGPQLSQGRMGPFHGDVLGNASSCSAHTGAA